MKTLIVTVLMVCASSAIAQAQPLVKTGSCPSGYRMSGNYCVPNSADTKPAMPKVGSCPSGYRMSGNYCLKN